MNTRILIVCLTMLMVYSCKKQIGEPVKGKVIDALTGAPVNNARVEIYRYEFSLFGNGMRFIADTLTDAKGYFSLPFVEGTMLKVRKDAYLVSDEISYLEDEQYQFTHQVKLMPCYSIRLHLKNNTHAYRYIWIDRYGIFESMDIDTVLFNVVYIGANATSFTCSVKVQEEDEFLAKDFPFYPAPVKGDTTLVTLEY